MLRHFSKMSVKPIICTDRFSRLARFEHDRDIGGRKMNSKVDIVSIDLLIYRRRRKKDVIWNLNC